MEIPQPGEFIARQMDMLVWIEHYQSKRKQLLLALLDKYLEDDTEQKDYDAWRQGTLTTQDYLYREEIRKTNQEIRNQVLERNARDFATKKTMYADVPGWERLRGLVYERDGGICQICKRDVPWRYYELGHLVDRVCGGLDVPENVVVMCSACNQNNKPLHESVHEALAYCETGGRRSLYARHFSDLAST